MKPCEFIAIINIAIKGNGIIAREYIRKGEIILSFFGKPISRKKVKNPNAVLQLDEDIFLESDGTADESLNHSCNPNCYIDFKQLNLVSMKDIQKGQELTFDYNTSEYDLIDQGCSFTCFCGSEDCVGDIKGFKYLPLSHKKKIESFLSPFLKKKWKEEL